MLTLSTIPIDQPLLDIRPLPPDMSLDDLWLIVQCRDDIEDHFYRLFVLNEKPPRSTA